MKMRQRQGKGAFTLIELIVVIALLILLMVYLVPKLSGPIAKGKDTARVKVLQEFLTYYESGKQSLGSYPGKGIVVPGGEPATSVRSLAKKVGTQAAGAGFKAVFDFSGPKDADGFFPGADIKAFQEFGVANSILGSAHDMKTLPEGEQMVIFTSKTSKRMAACIKLYAATEASQDDGDGIPNDKDPNGTDASKNGNRILVMGNMKLFKQLGTAAVTACQNDIVDPRDL